jgi:NADH-quinone oxidoreductase subunit N
LGYHSVPGVSLTALAAVIGLMGAATATVGNVAAFTQTNIKRLLAYSSIAHAGYMLCALSLLVRGNGNANLTSTAAQAILLYLAVYLFMNLGAFTCAGIVYRQTASEKIEDYAGMARRSPLVAVCMAVFLFSLVGLPPLAGFNAKLNVMLLLGSNGGWWWGLVIIIGINTVLSLYYYLRIVKVMFFSDSDAPAFLPNPIGIAVCVLCAVMLFAMFIGYSPLTTLTTAYGKVFLAQAR